MRWWDIPRVAELEALLFSEDSPWSAEMFWAELAEAHHYVVSRAADGSVTGYAGLAGYADEITEIRTIGVDPAARRQGIGQALLADLIDAADGRKMLLDVRVDNVAAQQLYGRNGFQRVGLRRRYYQPSGADAYTMVRPRS